MREFDELREAKPITSTPVTLNDAWDVGLSVRKNNQSEV